MSQFFATLMLISMCTIMAVGIGDGQKLQDIDKECTLLEERAIPYVWGAYFSIMADCSGAQYDICKVLGVKRTTAYRMWLGYGNWGTNNIEGSAGAFQQGKFPDLVFFNYQGKIASHVGMLRDKKPNEIIEAEKLRKDTRVFAEASSSKKYFKRTTIVQGDGRYKAILGIKKLDL